MRNFGTIWRREMAACFLSPVAYVTAVVFLAVAGWTFIQAVERNVGLDEQLANLLFMSLFFWMPVLVTVISMRLFAEEKRLGTIEMLLTAPVTELEVVLGKYAGAFTFLFLVMAPLTIDVYILVAHSPAIDGIDPGALAGGGLILLLLSAFSLAIGLLVSLLTRNQIVAGIACFAAICSPFLIGYSASVLPVASETTFLYLSPAAHVLDFSRGLVDTRPMVLYATGTFFVLFLAVRVLESRRWR